MGGGGGGTDNQLFTSEDFSVITKFHTSSCLIHHPSFTSLHVCSFSQSFSLSLSLSVSLSLSHSHTQTLKYKIQGTMIRVDHSYIANKVCHNEAKNNNNNNNSNKQKKKTIQTSTKSSKIGRHLYVHFSVNDRDILCRATDVAVIYSYCCGW